MPDWKNEIRKRLEALGIEPAREIGMIEELSQHLEQHYEDLLSGGADEKAATEAVLGELANSDLLASGLTSTGLAPKQDPEPQAEAADTHALLEFEAAPGWSR